MSADSNSLRARIVRELPYLRRYARAISGSQSFGDAAVREMLEAIVADPDQLREGYPVRLELYRLFHQVWQPKSIDEIDASEPTSIGALPVLAREALMLNVVEGFTLAQAGEILGLPVEEVEQAIARARIALSDGLNGSVLIIEDEAIIAIHLQKIVQSLDGKVVGVARTRKEAVALAGRTHPDMVLADISLGDGSSGIDAVNDILAEEQLPVIFITAFPERLLTGEKPEPTYLITKPFEPETVAATMWQAMLVHREAQHAPHA